MTSPSPAHQTDQNWIRGQLPRAPQANVLNEESFAHQIIQIAMPISFHRADGSSVQLQTIDGAPAQQITELEQLFTERYRSMIPSGSALLFRGRSDFLITAHDVVERVQRERLRDELHLTRSKRSGASLSDGAMLLCTAGNQGLASRVLHHLGAGAGKLLISKFANSETRIEIQESVRDKHVFVLAPMTQPVNEGLVETILLIQALRLADAKRITLIVPYYAYSRQDRKADLRSPISARCVADLLHQQGAHQIVTVDLHASQIEGLLQRPIRQSLGAASTHSQHSEQRRQ